MRRLVPTSYETSVKKSFRAALNLIALIPSNKIRQMLVIFLDLNSKELYQSSGKEKEGRRFEFVFTSSSCNDGKEMDKKA